MNRLASETGGQSLDSWPNSWTSSLNMVPVSIEKRVGDSLQPCLIAVVEVARGASLGTDAGDQPPGRRPQGLRRSALSTMSKA